MKIIDNFDRLTTCSSLKAGAVFRTKTDNAIFIKTDTESSVDLSNGSCIKVTGMVEEVDAALIVGVSDVPVSEEKYSELKGNVNKLAIDFCDALHENVDSCSNCPFSIKCSWDSCTTFIWNYFNI